MRFLPLLYKFPVSVTLGPVACLTEALKVTAVVEVLADGVRDNVVYHLRRLGYTLGLAFCAQGMLGTEGAGKASPSVCMVGVGAALTLVGAIVLIGLCCCVPGKPAPLVCYKFWHLGFEKGGQRETPSIMKVLWLVKSSAR